MPPNTQLPVYPHSSFLLFIFSFVFSCLGKPSSFMHVVMSTAILHILLSIASENKGEKKFSWPAFVQQLQSVGKLVIEISNVYKYFNQLQQISAVGISEMRFNWQVTTCFAKAFWPTDRQKVHGYSMKNLSVSLLEKNYIP